MPGTAFAGPNTGATPTSTDTTPAPTDTTVTATVTTPAPRVATTTAITGTTQASTPGGTTLTVSVSVTPASGTTAPTGSVKVTAGAGSCFVTLAEQGSSATGAGSCPISNLSGGYYTLTATYEGSAGFTGSSTTGSVKIAQPSQAPYFVAANPPLSATVGQVYAYTFHAKGFPAPTYALGGGAPGWLHINSYSGAVWGTVPWWVNKFSYAVTASNSSGSATAGPYTVWVRHGSVAISTSLSCPAKVHTGQKSSCTLYVTNDGSSPAPGVTAQIALPSPLRAKYCGFTWNWNVGCSISDNTAYMNLGTIYPGQTQQLTVVFVAKSGFSLWGLHPGHRFTVKVVGSAASHGFWWIPGPRVSFSVAYITIIPWGHWW